MGVLTLRRTVGCVAAAAVALAVPAVAPTRIGLGLQPARAATGPTISSWMTTPDRSQLLAPGASPTFDTAGPRPGQLITVDPSRTYQTMDGFGASITDSSAALLYRLPAAQRDAVMSSIFSPTDGIGMSFLRQRSGPQTSSTSRITPTTTCRPGRPT